MTNAKPCEISSVGQILPSHQGGILKYTDCVTEGNAINNKKEKEIPLS